ncbi:hypothetical protein MXM84_08970 [Acinetobacter pittii]|uniref:hypothetical protein n=1 Tax=Acinetobacter pittii TaxID=48296 RepID=UPI002DBC4D4B|nr:hypothetical protein [Acinetobacter pittii]MEB6624625.1 hypothetical protein [Acinetobacter pittii]
MNNNVGVVVFLLLMLASVLMIIIGSIALDALVIIIGVLLGMCALLVKLEFNIYLAFEK